MIKLLKKAYKHGLIDFLDIKIASFLAGKKNPLLILIFTLLCFKTRNGHVCLNIKKIRPENFFENKGKEIAYKICKTYKISYKKILNELKKSSSVCKTNNLISPIVLSKNKIYFQKMWINEKLVSDFFSYNPKKKVNTKKLKKILNNLFNSNEKTNWQKIAIAMAVTKKITIISGGPGTGKTTIITKLLITLIKLNNKLNIKIGAPTGKSAARITESINNEINKLNFKKNYLNIPKKAETIHRILGFQKNNHSFYYNKNNLLQLDFLILDEASMIDLELMVKIIESLPRKSSLVLLGDENQLTSVESGSIFKDLCYFSQFEYSKKRIKELNKITNSNLQNTKKSNHKIKDNICILKKNYRFNPKSKINAFANAINFSNIKKVKEILNTEKKHIIFNNIDFSKENNLITTISKYYLNYLNLIKNEKKYKKCLDFFNKYRILTITNNGPFGVREVNKKLEKFFYNYNYIKKNKSEKNYLGQPIIITENNYSLQLFNGDVGLILIEKRKLKAFFKISNKKTQKINLKYLPKYETAYSMTVHKSQGSEFDHISLILPKKFDYYMNKELIYTAITRAKKSIKIYGKFDVFIKSIQNPTKRCSGLIDNLIFKK